MTSLHGNERQIRVLVAYISPLIASGIMAVLDSHAGFHAQLGVFDQGLDREHGLAEPFDVVITDKEPALRLARSMRQQTPPPLLRDARIFVINQGSGELDIRTALESGIQGYATVTLTHEELQEGVRTVARGRRYVCPQIARFLADIMTRESVTAREADVLGQLVRGRDNKTIALELGMAIGTVKAHIKALMSKLDARSRTQVVTIAISRGLVVLGGAEHPAASMFSFEANAVTKASLQIAA